MPNANSVSSETKQPQAAGDDKQITVLGIGNVLWADEGFGVRCVEMLQQCYEFTPNVTLMDGGTQGLYLIQHVQAADYLLIFDAIDYGLPPGEMLVIKDDDVPKYMGAKKMSLHQTGFQEVLALAELTGKYPEKVVLIGCQPQELEDYGGSLRPLIKAAIAPALQYALTFLKEWGADPTIRTTPLPESEWITLPHLAFNRYEQGRPSEEIACRIGDDRFMPERN